MRRHSNGQDDPIVALAAGDLHFSDKPPLLRSNEPSWFMTQRRVIKEIKKIATEFDVKAILYAGDIVHHWDDKASLVNFLMANLPHEEISSYAILGQHDLPNHNAGQVMRSAVWPLFQASQLHHPSYIYSDIEFEDGFQVGDENCPIMLYGFDYGQKIKPLKIKDPDVLDIALIHSYIWTGSHKYHGAPKEKYCSNYDECLKGYDVAIFGDNHYPFQYETKYGTKVLNCGTLMRRRSDELEYEPQVGLIHKSGKISIRKLDTSKDVYLTADEIKSRVQKAVDFSDLAEEFQDLITEKIEFLEFLERVAKNKKVSKGAKRVINEVIEKVRTK